MTARVLVVDDIPANVRLLETRLTAEYFEVLTGVERAGCAGNLRARAGRRGAARRDDAGHGRLRGLPAAEGQSADPACAGRDGDRARRRHRQGARARRRRRRFPVEAGRRNRADHPGPQPRPPEAAQRPDADARHRRRSARHRRSRPRRPAAGGRQRPSSCWSKIIARNAQRITADAVAAAPRRRRRRAGGGVADAVRSTNSTSRWSVLVCRTSTGCGCVRRSARSNRPASCRSSCWPIPARRRG